MSTGESRSPLSRCDGMCANDLNSSNIDLFAEHMCPEGAVHVPFKGAMKVCKRLQVDYAEAVVDFEFGHRMAVPVIQGVVIAEENHDLVMEQLAKDENERQRKEDEKRRKAALGQWRRFLMCLRIVERINQDYGEAGSNEAGQVAVPANASHEERLPGGFLQDDEDGNAEQDSSAFFPWGGGQHDDSDDDGNLVLEKETE